MRFVQSTPQDIDWLSKKIGKLNNDVKGISAIFNDGRLAGVSALDQWTNTSAKIHVAIKSKIAFKNFALIRETFNYVFNTAGRITVISYVSSDNVKALKFNKLIGFEHVATIKDAIDNGVDLVINEMRREDCRWIDREMSHG